MAEVKITESLYPSNSVKKKEKHVEKVIEGDVKTRKQPLRTKLAHTFIADDVDDVKSYIFMEVLIPAVKNTISEMVTKAIDLIFWGDSGSKKSKGTYVSYNSYSSGKSHKPASKKSTDFRDIIYDTRAEAEEVLGNMTDLIVDYGAVSVADLYDLVGITGNFTDNKYGWVDLAGAKVHMVRGGGYSISFPRAEQLD